MEYVFSFFFCSMSFAKIKHTAFIRNKQRVGEKNECSQRIIRINFNSSFLLSLLKYFCRYIYDNRRVVLSLAYSSLNKDNGFLCIIYTKNRLNYTLVYIYSNSSLFFVLACENSSISLAFLSFSMWNKEKNMHVKYYVLTTFTYLSSFFSKKVKERKNEFSSTKFFFQLTGLP